MCANEWRDGICKKPTVSCHECAHRSFEPVTDGVMREHLTGAQVVGLYAFDKNSRCRFVVADCDHESCREDTCALARACRRLDIPMLPEILRSGDGAHVWFFFDAPVAVGSARQLVAALIERTCREERLLSLSSHDCVSPGRDSLTGAGLGSLVALPLQKSAREHMASLFVDDELFQLDDQWQALEDVALIGVETLQALIERVVDGHSGSGFHGAVAEKTHWRRSDNHKAVASVPSSELPSQLVITLADGIYVERLGLP